MLSDDGRTSARVQKGSTTLRIKDSVGRVTVFSLVDLFREANYSSSQAFLLAEQISCRQDDLRITRRSEFVSLFQGGRRRRFIDLHGRRCRYCGIKGDAYKGPDGRAWHIDHITPLARGGSNEASNFALACCRCNVKKGARSWPPPPTHS